MNRSLFILHMELLLKDHCMKGGFTDLNFNINNRLWPDGEPITRHNLSENWGFERPGTFKAIFTIRVFMKDQNKYDEW